MKATTVEIVRARRKGITGYVNVGRGTLLGNPFKTLANGGHYSQIRTVELFRELFYSQNPCDPARGAAINLLSRDYPDGVIRIGCPCNGAIKRQPCHATVIKEFLEGEIALRWEEVEK